MANETTIDEYVPDEVESAAWEALSPLLPEMDLWYEGQNHKYATPYATLGVISRSDVGNPTISEVDENGRQTLHQVIEGTLSVKVFGGNARQHLDNLRSRIKKTTSREKMLRQNFIIRSTADVEKVNLIRDGVYSEPFAFLDMGFRITQRFYDDVGLIEHVKADGTIQDVAVSFTIDILNPGA